MKKKEGNEGEKKTMVAKMGMGRAQRRRVPKGFEGKKKIVTKWEGKLQKGKTKCTKGKAGAKRGRVSNLRKKVKKKRRRKRPVSPGKKRRTGEDKVKNCRKTKGGVKDASLEKWGGRGGEKFTMKCRVRDERIPPKRKRGKNRRRHP